MSEWTVCRLSFGPLEERVGGSAFELAVKLGYPGTRSGATQIQRFRRHGVGPRLAESLAVKAGWLPDEIWGRAWVLSDEAERELIGERNKKIRSGLLRRRERFWPWPDNYEIAPHTCAREGVCRHG